MASQLDLYNHSDYSFSHLVDMVLELEALLQEKEEIIKDQASDIEDYQDKVVELTELLEAKDA